MRSIGRTRIAWWLLFAAGLAAGGCDGGFRPGAAADREEFVTLYVRLLRSRETPASGDTLNAAELARLEEYVRGANLEPEEWSALLTRIRDEARQGEAPAGGEPGTSAE